LSDPVLRLWLSKIQGWFNESLNQEQDIPDHVEHPPFHLDYIDDSGVPNAIAFRSDGYSFIGITMTLISTLWEVCIRLSRSDTIVALIGVGQPLEECGPVKFCCLKFSTDSSSRTSIPTMSTATYPQKAQGPRSSTKL
jgi:hypothetical protein